MKLAVIADIHANWPAFESVLDSIAKEGADGILCLGDTVGYNAEPQVCVSRLRAMPAVVILGNHDADVALAARSPGTNSVASAVQDWTRQQLSEDSLAYIRKLPNKVVSPAGYVAVHGCYLNDTHVTGYVTSTMLEDNLQAIASRGEWPKVGFCGHTHSPLMGWLEGDVCVEPTMNGPLRWPATARAVLINPGSVGQPRDGDFRASFALVDLHSRRVEVRRVEYDVAKASAAILNAGLPKTLADRLWEGR